MPGAYALPVELRDKAVVGAGAFAGGIAWGYAMRARPDLATMGAFMVAGVGLVAATMTKGMPSELLTGVSCTGLTAIGVMIPDWLQPVGTVGRPARTRIAPNPRLLPAAVSAAGVERGVYSNARIRVV